MLRPHCVCPASWGHPHSEIPSIAQVYQPGLPGRIVVRTCAEEELDFHSHYRQQYFARGILHRGQPNAVEHHHAEVIIASTPLVPDDYPINGSMKALWSAQRVPRGSIIKKHYGFSRSAQAQLRHKPLRLTSAVSHSCDSQQQAPCMNHYASPNKKSFNPLTLGPATWSLLYPGRRSPPSSRTPLLIRVCQARIATRFPTNWAAALAAQGE